MSINYSANRHEILVPYVQYKVLIKGFCHHVARDIDTILSREIIDWDTKSSLGTTLPNEHFVYEWYPFIKISK